MADDKDEDVAVQAATLLFEARISVAAVSMGLQKLIDRPETAPTAGELGVLKRRSDQASDALEALQGVAQERLGIGPKGTA